MTLFFLLNFLPHFKIFIANAVKSSLIDYLDMVAPNKLEDERRQYFYEKVKKKGYL